MDDQLGKLKLSNYSLNSIFSFLYTIHSQFFSSKHIALSITHRFDMCLSRPLCCYLNGLALTLCSWMKRRLVNISFVGANLFLKNLPRQHLFHIRCSYLDFSKISSRLVVPGHTSHLSHSIVVESLISRNILSFYSYVFSHSPSKT